MFSAMIFALTLFCIPTSVSAKTTSSKNNVDLTKSILNEFPDTPEINQLKNEIKNNAKSMQQSTYYCKIAETPSGTEIVQAYNNEADYKTARKQEEDSQKSSRKKRSLPITQNFSWIQLKLECWGMGGRNFSACGSYKWLTVPAFTFNDVFTIGHDSNCTFDNQSSWGTFITPYMDNLGRSRQDTQILKPYNGGNFSASASGVGYKFKLKPGYDFGSKDPGNNQHQFGLMYVNGTVTNGSSTNLQVSYGHSQIALNFSASGAIQFKSNGSLNFTIAGTKDVVTTGDRYVIGK
ncbi:hypothetical protein [Clostridium botulinum]|uniref:hypothetical protein n=1 Tax=Clostridium botulinum TaxID=1491 RepID=UPI00223FB015|nr:hypothetical protein [Clostridium botulinum]